MSQKILATIGVCAALAASALFAQAPAAPAFEVASIKPADPITQASIQAGKLHVGMQVDGARVDIGFVSLADLIPIAYRVKPFQVVGPDWMRMQRYNVLAKLPEGASPDQVPEMLQALLADRFKLTVHRDSREQSVYGLVVAKGGPKFKESSSDADAPTPPPDSSKPGISLGGPNGQQIRASQDGKGATISGGPTGPMRMAMGGDGNMRMEASKITMAAFADLLTGMVDRPVVDMTDLKGTYQITLELSMEDIMTVARAAASKAGIAIPGLPTGAGGNTPNLPATAASDPSGGSIFTTVQKLGLKLEPRKAPVETIVVDHAEKAPTEN